MPSEDSFDRLRERISSDLSQVDDELDNLLMVTLGPGGISDQATASKIESRIRGLAEITSRIGRNSEAIYQKGRIDPRTQLVTRTYLDEMMGILDKQGEAYPFAFIMGDVDRFHDYNETFGHVQGDNALKMVGRAIKAKSEEIFRGFETLPARYGGEELCILVMRYSNPISQLAAYTEQIRRAVEETAIAEFPGRDSPQNRGFEHVTITLGCGIQMEGEPVQDLIGRVNKYMVGSKRDGKRNFVVSQQ